MQCRLQFHWSVMVAYKVAAKYIHDVWLSTKNIQCGYYMCTCTLPAGYGIAVNQITSDYIAQRRVRPSLSPPFDLLSIVERLSLSRRLSPNIIISPKYTTLNIIYVIKLKHEQRLL